MIYVDSSRIATIRRRRPKCSPARPIPYLQRGWKKTYFVEGRAMKQKCLQVLIADPDHQCRDSLKLQFQSAGYEVALAVSGADVALQYELEAPNVLILDTQIPDMDAFDLCESIRRESIESDVVVIILSELSEEMNQVQLEQRADYVGADYLVIKPCKENQIVEFVSDLIDQSEGNELTNRSVFPTCVSWPTTHNT